MTDHSGQCLCGGTTYKASGAPSAPHACHCDLCQRFSGSAFVGVDFDALTIDGPVRWFASSDWAERGSCGTCGSALFWRLQDGSGKQVVTIGSLDNTRHLDPINVHLFADNSDPSYNFNDGAARLSTEETLALFAGASDA